ncbi:hypothetical protein bAD24_III10475 [Burkholderia sp. AD24]|nr:hypothetical protein bAD24_III10475 [Burkholderia sp. AD24]
MYSYEDRVRAVELYLKLGKRANTSCTTVRPHHPQKPDGVYRRLCINRPCQIGTERRKRVAANQLQPSTASTAMSVGPTV